MKNFLIVTSGVVFVGSNLIKFLLIKTNFFIISLDYYSSGFQENHIEHNRAKYLNSNVFGLRKIFQIFFYN
jgi:UDP-glucose 4-epimerase